MSLIDKDYQLTIPSNPDSIGELEAFIDQIKEEVDIPDEIYGNILIALTEAVNNSIIHGNGCDPMKSVTIKGDVGDLMLTFVVTDEGDGFNYNDLPDPTAPENINKVTGRGVFLMRQLSDHLTYSDNGATVQMHFNL